jgi:TolB-like protein/cytochrome c-type biogenesis protein CcmH/NrfG
LVKRHKKTGTLVLATLTLAVAGILLDAQLMRPQSGVIDSIAVLPFVNSGGDESREYLSDVVTDSLINSLAQLPQLRVMAGTAVFNYKGKEVDPIKVGSELNVRAVLIGSLKQKGENLTINVELVDTLDGSHIWGDQFDAKPSNILSMQKEITQRIINRLEIKLSGDEKRRLTKNHTDNVDAYNAYLQGRYHMKKLTEAGNKLAIESFKKAIEIDQNYALAYVGLADCYMITGQTEMREMLTTALMLDYTLAEAHATLATAYFIIDWNWAAAEQEFTEAIKLNSNYPNTHYWYAFYLLAMQQTHKAVSEMKRALELDPLSLNINYEMGNIFYHARLFSDAREQIQETLVLDPNYFPAHLLLGQILLQEGRNEDAIIEIKRAISLERTGNTLAILAYAYAVSGRWDEALKMLKTEPIMRGYYKAAAYAALGQEDEAFKYLERSLMVRDGLMVYLRADPKLDSLRSDPRFASLLRRMHFQN